MSIPKKGLLPPAKRDSVKPLTYSQESLRCWRGSFPKIGLAHE